MSRLEACRWAGRGSSSTTLLELSQAERRPGESLYDFVVRLRRMAECVPHLSDAAMVTTFCHNVHHRNLAGVLDWEEPATAAELWRIVFYHALNDSEDFLLEGRRDVA